MSIRRTPLTLATRNLHKTREFAEILGSAFEVRDLSTIPEAPAVIEDGKTFEENAILKACAVSRRQAGFVLADDSGMEVVALDGAPGIYSARYAGSSATDAQNITKLLAELQRTKAIGPQRRAQFRCALALARAGTILHLLEGTVEGIISDEPRGNGGFGYDPIFVPEGHSLTFGELPSAVKNRISHRARALARLMQFPLQRP